MRSNHPVEIFVLLAQSPTHIKIIFYNTYCFDIQIKAGGLVYVRDGAISLFDQRKVIEDIQPLPGKQRKIQMRVLNSFSYSLDKRSILK